MRSHLVGWLPQCIHWPPVIYTTYATFRNPPTGKMLSPLPEDPEQFHPITISARNPEHLHVNEVQMQVKLFSSFQYELKRPKQKLNMSHLSITVLQTNSHTLAIPCLGIEAWEKFLIALDFTLWALDWSSKHSSFTIKSSRCLRLPGFLSPCPASRS